MFLWTCYCFGTKAWTVWPKRENRLIPFKGRHSPSRFFFHCFENEVRESVLSWMVSTGFHVSVTRFTFEFGNNCPDEMINDICDARHTSDLKIDLRIKDSLTRKQSESNNSLLVKLYNTTLEIRRTHRTCKNVYSSLSPSSSSLTHFFVSLRHYLNWVTNISS